MAMHNTDQSIKSFARSCFNYLDRKMDLWFSTKDTISKHMIIISRIFAEIYENEYRENLKKRVLSILHFLMMRCKGSAVIRRFCMGFENYDGDVMSDMIATASKS